MRRQASVWLAELSGLGRAFLDVLKAEWAALTGDLGDAAKLFLKALLLLLVALGLLGWATILLSLALVAFLENYLEPWQAALVVAIGIILTAAALFAWAKVTLDRATPPGAGGSDAGEGPHRLAGGPAGRTRAERPRRRDRRRRDGGQ